MPDPTGASRMRVSALVIVNTNSTSRLLGSKRRPLQLRVIVCSISVGLRTPMGRQLQPDNGAAAVTILRGLGRRSSAQTLTVCSVHKPKKSRSFPSGLSSSCSFRSQTLRLLILFDQVSRFATGNSALLQNIAGSSTDTRAGVVHTIADHTNILPIRVGFGPGD
jgi:hypothetical protein